MQVASNLGPLSLQLEKRKAGKTEKNGVRELVAIRYWNLCIRYEVVGLMY